MTAEIKVQYTTAVLLVLGAFVLASVSFFFPPQGEISQSVLWFFAQALMFAATIFGVGAIFKSFYANTKH